jgi:hypothetical protein
MNAKQDKKKEKKNVAVAQPKKCKKETNKSNNKPIEITIEKKIYGEVPEKYHFYLNDGKKLKNIYELIDALDHMSDEVFHYHVNVHKNDFSNWIKNVMEEEKLAKDIEKVEDKVEAQLKILKHVVKGLVK